MYTCTLCHYETTLDDALFATERGQCICLRCYLREVGRYTPMPGALRREVRGVLDAMNV